MNRYNFCWNKPHPLDIVAIQKTEKNVCNTLDDFKNIFKDYSVAIIKDATTESLRDDFCIYRHSEYSGYPQLVHKLNRYEPLKYSENQRKCMILLEKLFPQFQEELKFLDFKKTEYYNFVDHIKTANWKVSYDVQHNWTHTVNIKNAHDVDTWYAIQLLYRAGCWLKGFKETNNFKWDLPMVVFALRSDEDNFMSIHPGNSRNMFKEFDSTVNDVIFIYRKQDAHIFTRNPNFQYYDTDSKIAELLNEKRIEYILDESGYTELFFLPKQQNVLNDETILFFSDDIKLKREYIEHCTQLINHKRDKSKYSHPNPRIFEYKLHVELKNRVLYYQGEPVAILDNDGTMLLVSDKKSYSFNLNT